MKPANGTGTWALRRTSDTVLLPALVLLVLSLCMTCAEVGDTDEIHSSFSPASDNRGPVAQARARAAAGRKGKFLNVFQIIRFANTACNAGNRNGTCYTEAECDSRGGTNGGTCAAGFGVCCIITIGCGASSSENCTYFNSDNPMAGTCNVEICPCGDNICQIRLDFESFTITGPTTITNSIAKRVAKSGVVNGETIGDGVASVADFGNCRTDTFSVTNPDGPSPPTICGVNSGEHMYVEASECCNDLTFKLGNTAVGTSMATRSWSIKATQYNCDFQNLAPQGCVQYFFGSNLGDVRSYNYQNRAGVHLANQDQMICVRRERGNCRICWTDAADADFAVSGKAKSINQNNGVICCSYGAPSALTKVQGFDCVHIPNAMKQTANAIPEESNLCGNNKGLPGVTVCSVRCPFTLNFRSDEYEVTSPTALMSEAQVGQPGNNGFQLVYFMDAINCNPAMTVNTIA